MPPKEGYAAEYAAWLADPVAWWERQADALLWRQRWTTGFDPAIGAFGQYFVGGTLNLSENCLDRHVEAGNGERAALIWDSAMEARVLRFTYAELRDRVAKTAGALAARGVAHGDRVVIYMPMVPEAVIAMLACARLGAIHSVVFGGFAAAELAKRIEDAEPRAIISASCGLEPGRTIAYKPLLDQAIDLSAHKPEFCLILQRPAMLAPRSSPAATKTSSRPKPPPRRTTRCPSRPPTRSISFTPPARPESPRASSATPAAMPWR